jgi:sn-glycerol 3-phosphate transport system ATP-binding protein
MADRASAGALPARVDLVEELGATRIVHLTTSLGGFMISAPADGAPPAAEVHLRLPNDRLSLFDPASGLRVEPDGSVPAGRDD